MTSLHPHRCVLWSTLILSVTLCTSVALAQTDSNENPTAESTHETDPEDSSTPANGASDQAQITYESTIRILNRSAESIKIGEPLHLRVHVDMPERAQFLSLRPIDNPFVERINDVRRMPAARTGLAVTVFRPGTYEFAVEALWIDPDGHQRSTRSAPLKIRVLESVTDHELATLAPPGDYITLRSRNLWLIGGGFGLLVLLALSFAWFVWRRLKAQRLTDDLPDEVPARPAWEVALEEIHALRNDRVLLEKDRVQFHHRISEILRTWLQGRFDIRAPEMTSEEILDEISPRRLVLGGWIEQIHMILADSDLVKFAKFAPSEEHSIILLQELEDLVMEVRRSDASPPDIPSPIEGDEPKVQESEHAAPQYHQPGVAIPRFVPEDAPKPTIVSLDFRKTPSSNAEPPKANPTRTVPRTTPTEDE